MESKLIAGWSLKTVGAIKKVIHTENALHRELHQAFLSNNSDIGHLFGCFIAAW